MLIKIQNIKNANFCDIFFFFLMYAIHCFGKLQDKSINAIFFKLSPMQKSFCLKNIIN